MRYTTHVKTGHRGVQWRVARDLTEERGQTSDSGRMGKWPTGSMLICCRCPNGRPDSVPGFACVMKGPAPGGWKVEDPEDCRRPPAVLALRLCKRTGWLMQAAILGRERVQAGSGPHARQTSELTRSDSARVIGWGGQELEASITNFSPDGWCQERMTWLRSASVKACSDDTPGRKRNLSLASSRGGAGLRSRGAGTRSWVLEGYGEVDGRDVRRKMD